MEPRANDLTLTPLCRCSGEYVELRDGGSLLAPELGRYCQDAPSTLTTSDNLLYVKYFTNITDPNNGFSAQVSLGKVVCEKLRVCVPLSLEAFILP